MTKLQFRDRFRRILMSGARIADERLGKRVPRRFLIELHGPTPSDDRLISLDEAVERMYLGEDRFYKIIDIAIQKVSFQHTIAFVRVSGHPPGPFHETWDPAHFGPFKQILVQDIVDSRVPA